MWGGMLLKLQENYMSIGNVTWHKILYLNNQTIHKTQNTTIQNGLYVY